MLSSDTYMQRQYTLLPKWEGNQSVSLLTYWKLLNCMPNVEWLNKIVSHLAVQ